MDRKILFFISAICGYGFMEEVRASLLPQNALQLYLGCSVGTQRFSGHRDENAFYNPDPAGGFPTGVPGTIYFANQKPFSNINGFYLGHVGFTWNIPQTLIFLGPEIYLGRGSLHNDLNVSVKDDPAFTPTIRSVNASLRQSTFFGGVVQIGFNAKWGLRPYMMLGLERSQFQYRGNYTPRSQAFLSAGGGLGPADDYSPTSLNRTKWLKGFLWGLGCERQISSIKLGADIRFIHYKEFKADTLADAFDPETFYTIIKPKNLRFGLRVSYVF
jgi:hypothetical protein